MAIWDDILTERDKKVFSVAGYGKRMGFGKRPVILIIDVNKNFLGEEPEDILESVKKWRNSCGLEGWEAVKHIKKLISVSREKRIPIIYTTTADPRIDGFDSGRWRDKNARKLEDHIDIERRKAVNEICPEIAPEPHDIVIKKGKPSAFFSTMLVSYLTDLEADSLIVCGTTTSGCVRATVVDGFSYNYKIAVVEECTFDRGQSSHKINLFDMHQKYADVVKLDEVIQYLKQLPTGLFDGKISF